MLFGSFRYRRKASPEAGYLYLVLLLMVVFMVIGALALAPAITGQLKRDRENEMIHRGVQYSRAVKKYYKKFGAYPTTVDQLLNTNNLRFLRQKYKDPMTANGEWRLLHYGDVQLGANQLGAPGAGGTTGGVAGTSSFQLRPVFLRTILRLWAVILWPVVWPVVGIWPIFIRIRAILVWAVGLEYYARFGHHAPSRRNRKYSRRCT